MKSKLFSPIFIILLLCTYSSIADDNKAAEQNVYQLPWEKIAENFKKKSQFCSFHIPPENICNFVFDPNASRIVLPTDIKIFKDKTKVKYDLSKWQQDKWKDLPNVIVDADSNGFVTCNKIFDDGFYKILLTYQENDVNNKREFYAIIAKKWKKDLLAFCRHFKEKVETNPDHQLVFSSIAISHYDYLMEAVSEANMLSKDVLNILIQTLDAKKSFDNNNLPDFVMGWPNIVRLKRFAGSPVAEFVVTIPKEYDSIKKYGVLLSINSPDGQKILYNKTKDRNKLINIRWASLMDDFKEPEDRWNKYPVWEDFQSILNILKGNLKIDEDKLYIEAWCGGGVPAMNIVFHHPDKWADCFIATGNSFLHLAGNVSNLPGYFINHNPMGVDSGMAWYEFAARCFEYKNCKLLKNGYDLTKKETDAIQHSELIRQLRPDRVYYTIDSLANPKAYWVKIEERVDENFDATVDARITGNTIQVNTKNVDLYKLFLKQAPLDSNKPVEVVENGVSLGIVTGDIFSREITEYENELLKKNEYLCGPISDAFNNPYVVVYGIDQKDSLYAELCKKTAELLAAGGPCYNDDNLPPSLIDSHNLILVGSTENNSWLAQIIDNDMLPIKIEGDTISAATKIYDAKKTGFILIHPNPLYPQRYVAIFFAKYPNIMKNMVKAYSLLGKSHPADMALFEVTEGNDIKWHIREKFNRSWDWHNSWDEVLLKVNNNYQKWQWNQLAAKIIKKQFVADFAIIENIFETTDILQQTQITFRDLYNSIKNSWIVKIELPGKELKKLILAPTESNSENWRKAGLIVEGLSFIKTGKDLDLAGNGISDVQDDKIYTLAIPQHLIKTTKTGIWLKNYKIVGDDFLALIIRGFLQKHENKEIENLLENMKLNVLL